MVRRQLKNLSKRAILVEIGFDCGENPAGSRELVKSIWQSCQETIKQNAQARNPFVNDFDSLSQLERRAIVEAACDAFAKDIGNGQNVQFDYVWELARRTLKH